MPSKSPRDCLFEAFPTLETPRLFLRALSLDDAEALLHVFSDRSVAEHQDWEPFSDLPKATAFLAERLDLFQRRNRVNWGLVRRDTGTLIGQLGMHTISDRDRRAELAFDLSPDHWRKRFMTEALNAVLSFGFGHCQLNKVVAQSTVENRRSHAFLQSVGFSVEGRLHAHYHWKGMFHDVNLYGMTRAEFRMR
jgi:ribosomal-protein-alanine N-acetyltransferase